MLKKFHAFLAQMIAHHREHEEIEDLLSILLQVTDEDTGEGMSDDALIDEMLGLVMGGHESAATALTWIWYELAQNPEAEARVHEEVDTVFGDGPVSADGLAKLDYTKMVIDETMRLHPPFWFENRNAMSDTELGGVPVKKGSMVVLSRYSLHRNPAFWKDPDTFDPQRFDKENPENSKASFAFLPFSSGPRICIGMYFATLEILAVIAIVARRYRLIVDESDRHQMTAHLTMSPKYGVRVRLEKR